MEIILNGPLFYPREFDYVAKETVKEMQMTKKQEMYCFIILKLITWFNTIPTKEMSLAFLKNLYH